MEEIDEIMAQVSYMITKRAEIGQNYENEGKFKNYKENEKNPKNHKNNKNKNNNKIKNNSNAFNNAQNSINMKNEKNTNTKSLKKIYTILNKKYSYLKNFKEKTLLFQLDQSKDLGKITAILLLLLDKRSIESEAGEIVEKVAEIIQSFNLKQMIRGGVSSQVSDSNIFHLSVLKIIRRLLEVQEDEIQSSLGLKFVFQTENLILQAIKQDIVRSLKSNGNFGLSTFEIEFNKTLYLEIIEVLCILDNLHQILSLNDKRFLSEFYKKLEMLNRSLTGEDNLGFDYDLLSESFFVLVRFLEQERRKWLNIKI